MHGHAHVAAPTATPVKVANGAAVTTAQNPTRKSHVCSIKIKHIKNVQQYIIGPWVFAEDLTTKHTNMAMS